MDKRHYFLNVKAEAKPKLILFLNWIVLYRHAIGSEGELDCIVYAPDMMAVQKIELRACESVFKLKPLIFHGTLPRDSFSCIVVEGFDLDAIRCASIRSLDDKLLLLSKAREGGGEGE